MLAADHVFLIRAGQRVPESVQLSFVKPAAGSFDKRFGNLIGVGADDAAQVYEETPDLDLYADGAGALYGRSVVIYKPAAEGTPEGERGLPWACTSLGTTANTTSENTGDASESTPV